MNFRYILAASALVAASSMTQAQVSVQTSTVDLTAVREWSYYDPAFSLLSDQNGVVRFALNSLGTSRAATGNGENGDFLLETFNIHLHSGYRLTGFELTGNYNGQTMTFGSDGVATNSIRVSGQVVEQPFGVPYAAAEDSASNLNGSRSFALTANRLDLSGDKLFHLQAGYQVFASSSYSCGFDYGCREMPSYAEIGFSNTVLTLHTQAVPEPETYALMLAGLAGVGLVARRKRAASGK